MNGRICLRTRATTFWAVASLALLSLALNYRFLPIYEK